MVSFPTKMKPDAQQKKNNEARKVKEDGRRKVKTAVSFLNPKTNLKFCFLCMPKLWYPVHRPSIFSLEILKHVYGNKNHAGFIDGKCKGVGVGKRENRQKKIEKAVPVFFLSLCAHSYVLASLACCQIFDKKGRKMSLDRWELWKLKFCCWIRRLPTVWPINSFVLSVSSL